MNGSIMADNTYTKPPPDKDTKGFALPVLKYFRQVANRLNGLRIMGTYANNAAAVTAGLSVGELYQTATGEVRIVV